VPDLASLSLVRNSVLRGESVDGNVSLTASVPSAPRIVADLTIIQGPGFVSIDPEAVEIEYNQNSGGFTVYTDSGVGMAGGSNDQDYDVIIGARLVGTEKTVHLLVRSPT
jgi:hypothetical protein